jgi:hypothetical protein
MVMIGKSRLLVFVSFVHAALAGTPVVCFVVTQVMQFVFAVFTQGEYGGHYMP